MRIEGDLTHTNAPDSDSLRNIGFAPAQVDCMMFSNITIHEKLLTEFTFLSRVDKVGDQSIGDAVAVNDRAIQDVKFYE